MAKEPESTSERNHTDHESVIDKVARSIGKASGAVVAAASKVMPSSGSEKRTPAPKKARARTSGGTKQSVTKKQKRKAHKRKLKASNTKG
jgi:hypothetical protein